MGLPIVLTSLKVKNVKSSGIGGRNGAEYAVLHKQNNLYPTSRFRAQSNSILFGGPTVRPYLVPTIAIRTYPSQAVFFKVFV